MALRGTSAHAPTHPEAPLLPTPPTEPFDPDRYDEDDDPDDVEMGREDDIRRSAQDLLLVEQAKGWLLMDEGE